VRINQAGPELGEIHNAEHEGEQPGNVEKNDAPRETRKNLTDKELPGVMQRTKETLSPQDPPGARKKIGDSDGGTRESDADATNTPQRCRSEPAASLQVLYCRIGRSDLCVVDVYGLIKHVRGFS
jgi:hypothetical protein